MLILSLPNLLIWSYWFLIPESPRWLASRGRVKDFSRVVAAAAQANRKLVDEDVLMAIREIGNKKEHQEDL